MPGFVVSHEQFSGPLDLLLQLIEQTKLEITDISLSRVTEDFFAYVETHEEMPVYELADFLVVASRLLLLKSRAILPSTLYPAEEDRGDLAGQLRMYKRFVEASKQLESLLAQGQVSYGREQIVVQRAAGFYPPPNLSSERLRNAFVTVIEKLKPLAKLPETAIKRVISVRERIDHLRTWIEKTREGSFHGFISTAIDKHDIIVTFIAMLEMAKQREIELAQDDAFGDIIVRSRLE
jgi:segregation and condensation protein A